MKTKPMKTKRCKSLCNRCGREIDVRPQHKTGICWDCAEEASVEAMTEQGGQR